MPSRRGRSRKQPPKSAIIKHFKAVESSIHGHTADVKLVVDVDEMVKLRVSRSRMTRQDGEDINNAIILEMSIKGQPGWAEVGRF